MFVTIESRVTGDGRRRRKECRGCNHRATTYEVSAEFFKEAKKHSEIVGRVKAALGGTPAAAVVLEVQPERSCSMCTYMTRSGCSFGFPEAGDDFATECVHYKEDA